MIKDVYTKYEDCDDNKIKEKIKEFKNSPIIERINRNCKHCKHKLSEVIIYYRRTGENYNKKGQGYYYNKYAYKGSTKKYLGYQLKINWWKYLKKL